jgi:tetratricopeptide (TPR) repeat protein
MQEQALQPAYTGQPFSAITQEQIIPQYPPAPPDQPPYVAPQAPFTPPPLGRQTWYKALPKPIPIWALIGCTVIVVLALVVAQLTGSDWADGAKRVGIVAGILAVVVLLVTVVRMLLRMDAKSKSTRLIQLISAGLAILLLALLCLIGLTQQSAIHGLQAHAWEGQQQWQASINEYQLSGEGAPTSEDIAGVYGSWGEQLSMQQHYADALAKFNLVLNSYGSASAGVTRAQSDTITAYIAWGKQASQQHDYAAATGHFDTLLQLPYCAAACQSQAKALDATAYYNLAESQLAAQHYLDAVNNFQIVVSRFASSPEAQKLHPDYAKALLGHGKQQLASVCASAIPTYQQLSQQFGDTPEGRQAMSALKANQPVKGRFIGSIPNDPGLTLVAALMHGLYHNLPDSQFFQMLNGALTTQIQRNGSFTFNPLPQGTYDLVWGSTRSNGSKNFQFAYKSDGSAYYVANVGPLCPYDFGTLNENIPVAP